MKQYLKLMKPLYFVTTLHSCDKRKTTSLNSIVLNKEVCLSIEFKFSDWLTCKN